MSCILISSLVKIVFITNASGRGSKETLFVYYTRDFCVVCADTVQKPYEAIILWGAFHDKLVVSIYHSIMSWHMARSFK